MKMTPDWVFYFQCPLAEKNCHFRIIYLTQSVSLLAAHQLLGLAVRTQRCPFSKVCHSLCCILYRLPHSVLAKSTTTKGQRTAPSDNKCFLLQPTPPSHQKEDTFKNSPKSIRTFCSKGTPKIRPTHKVPWLIRMPSHKDTYTHSSFPKEKRAIPTTTTMTTTTTLTRKKPRKRTYLTPCVTVFCSCNQLQKGGECGVEGQRETTSAFFAKNTISDEEALEPPRSRVW